MSFSITSAAQSLLSNVLSGLGGTSAPAPSTQSPQTVGAQFLQLLESSLQSAFQKATNRTANDPQTSQSTPNAPSGPTTFEGLTENQYISGYASSINHPSSGGTQSQSLADQVGVPVGNALNAWYSSTGLTRAPGTVDAATGMVVADNGQWVPASEVTAYNAELTARATYLPQLQAVQAQIQQNFKLGYDSNSPLQQALMAQAASLQTLAWGSDYQPAIPVLG